MDLPGFGNDATSKTVNTLTLGSQSEWRFEVALDKTVNVKILQGHAEIFGTELALGHTYQFTATKLSIYTWLGCQIEWEGEVLGEYTSDESAMPNYANLHFALEKLRAQAAAIDTQYIKKEIGAAATSGQPDREAEGPKVLIIGPRFSGKTSLAKILTAYASKMGRSPVAISLDPKESMLSLPGTISAATFATMMDVEKTETWSSSATTGPMHIPPKNPIVYYYGSDSPTDNIRFYKSVMNRLSLAVSSRIAVDAKARISGTIIDATGILDPKVGYDLIDTIVADFSVDVVVTVGNERLYNDLLKRYNARQNMTVVKVPRSGGVVETDASYLRSIQQRLFKEYFYGQPKFPLSAFTVTVDISAVTVYKRAEQSRLVSSSALPIGTELSTAHESLITKTAASAALQNSILALLYASPSDSEEDIAESSVMGFVHILDVDETKHKMKVLMPIKSRLPAQVYLMGSYHYME
ncbi:Pre-mRNA cleavage complex II protein Clp1-domain-containing protein [Myxozyma melibiosi]|uniref:Polynucleotide 5'-hydroxyl-kinase GRC3 n=1 Tax=Myxozyma melibiosi TaxID=54550 RepID=A0ABR1EZV3_9ASCO